MESKHPFLLVGTYFARCTKSTKDALLFEIVKHTLEVVLKRIPASSLPQNTFLFIAMQTIPVETSFSSHILMG